MPRAFSGSPRSSWAISRRRGTRGEETDPPRAALLRDGGGGVAEALARLSAKQRVAVVLRDSFGFTYEEIARIARMPVGTAKCYVHRGRARLRAALEENTRA